MARHENAIAIWWVIGFGAALGLVPRTRMRRESLWVLGVLGLLAAWTALGFLWTSSDERTLAEVARVVHYAGVVVLVWCVVSPSTWRPVAGGILAGALAVCALALASRLAPDQFPDEVAGAFDTKRLSYPLGYWNAMSAWGAMSVAMALVWSAHARTSAARAASLAAVPVSVLVVYLTYSRAGVGGIAVALLAGLALSVNRWTFALHALMAAGCSALLILVVRGLPQIAEGTGTEGAGIVLLTVVSAAALAGIAVLVTGFVGADGWRLPARAARVATVSGAVLAILAFAAIGWAPASNAWDDFRDTDDVPSSQIRTADPAARLGSFEAERYELWSAAARGFRHELLHGVGPGTFEYHWNRGGGTLFVRDAHSLYLEQAAELGLPGLLITLVALLGLGALGVAARFRLKDPSQAGTAMAMCTPFVVFLFHAGVDWLWEYTAVSVLAFAAIAAAASAAPRGRWHLGWPPRVGIAVVALCASASALPGLLSTEDVRDSREAFKRDDLAGALEEARSAVSWEPWAATPYAQRALVQWADGRFESAAADLRKARDREPLNWRHPLLLARLEADRGRAGPATRAFRDAQRLRPGSPFLDPSPPAPAR